MARVLFNPLWGEGGGSPSSPSNISDLVIPNRRLRDVENILPQVSKTRCAFGHIARYPASGAKIKDLLTNWPQSFRAEATESVVRFCQGQIDQPTHLSPNCMLSMPQSLRSRQ